MKRSSSCRVNSDGLHGSATRRLTRAMTIGPKPDSLIAGGGLRTGQIIGATDLAATLFSRFGVDPDKELIDPTGRLHRLAEGRALF